MKRATVFVMSVEVKPCTWGIINTKPAKYARIHHTERGVKKVLVLGEKNFGFNEGKVDLTTQSHKEWYWNVRKLFDTFNVVSFDNLALEQLNIKRFFPADKYEEFNQGEHSFYINAVDGYFAPSSRSSDKTDWNETTIQNYFKQLDK